MRKTAVASVPFTLVGPCATRAGGVPATATPAPTATRTAASTTTSTRRILPQLLGDERLRRRTAPRPTSRINATPPSDAVRPEAAAGPLRPDEEPAGPAAVERPRGPPAGSSLGSSGVSNHSHSGGCRQVGSSRSYWLQLRKPASLTARPGVNCEPPSAHGPGSTAKLLVGTPPSREDSLSSQQFPTPWSSHQWSRPLWATEPSGRMPILLSNVWLWFEVS